MSASDLHYALKRNKAVDWSCLTPAWDLCAVRINSGGGADCAGDEAQDVLYDGETAHVLSGPRINTMNTHGTGCTTASAIAAELANGASVLAAARAAKTYVSKALQSSAALRIGSGNQRPFNHGFAALLTLICLIGGDFSG